MSGPLNVLAAAVLWGTTGTARSFAPHGASPTSVGAARIVFGGLLLLLLAVRANTIRPLLRRSSAVPLVVGAIAVAAYQLSFFSAVAKTGVAIGTVVTIGSSPVLTGFLAWMVERSPLTRRWWLSTAAAVAGCIALAGSGGGHNGVDLFGVMLALVAGLSYATFAVVSARLIARGAPSGGVMGLIFAGAGIPLLALLINSSPGWLFSPRGIIVTLHLTVLATAIAYLFYGRGLRHTPVAVAATLSLAEPATAALLGLVVLDEHLNMTASTGLALIAGALVILATPGRKHTGQLSVPQLSSKGEF